MKQTLTDLEAFKNTRPVPICRSGELSTINRQEYCSSEEETPFRRRESEEEELMGETERGIFSYNEKL